MALFGKSKPTITAELLDTFKRQRRYEQLRDLGEGGLSKVYSSFDTYLNRVVAVKELKPDNLDDPLMLQSFITESRLISYLDHPGVISLFDTFLRDDGTLCYTMKMIEGRPLADVLDYYRQKKRSHIPLSRFHDIFEKLCETLAYVHDKGVVHLDLKPDNIMIGRYGEVMVMDWGNAMLYNPEPYKKYLSRFSESADLISTRVDEKNVLIGTPMYMSPEQTLEPRDTLKPTSDIFSVGIILYEMLTGIYPFPADNNDMDMLFTNIRGFDPPPVYEINKFVPRRLSQICMKMLRKSQRNRYQTFHEIIEDIDDFYDSGQAFSTKMYHPGETIFSEGEEGEYSFVILQGEVEILKRSGETQIVLATLGKNEIVGELAIFTGGPRSATARASKQTLIRILNRADIRSELDKLSPWVGDMITGLSRRFIELNNKIIRLEKENEQPRTQHGAS
jgi:serine/threonine-protein kinase